MSDSRADVIFSCHRKMQPRDRYLHTNVIRDLFCILSIAQRQYGIGLEDCGFNLNSIENKTKKTEEKT